MNCNYAHHASYNTYCYYTHYCKSPLTRATCLGDYFKVKEKETSVTTFNNNKKKVALMIDTSQVLDK